MSLREILDAEGYGFERGQASCAAGPWETGPPPKDGTVILAQFKWKGIPDQGRPVTVYWGRDDRVEGWCLIGDIEDTIWYLPDPIRWARINMGDEP